MSEIFEDIKDAVRANDTDKVCSLLQQETESHDNLSDALALAASLGYTDLIIPIASYISQNSYLDLALWQAAIHNYFPIMEVLLDLGADVNSRQANSSLLFWATSTKNLEIIEFLLDKGADVNSRNLTVSWTPMMWAAYEGQIEIVHLFLRFGADASAVDLNGVSIDNLALLHGHRDVVELLKNWRSDSMTTL